ncbi:hypothetical protein EJ419_06445 [Alloscardovia theropitheci]|uniref:Uncharacterized protein n=1 Tax=Alloscardovia theropitheci TaxID=2496842 RepID=A0A4R0QRA2_9BIFI|nr:hypothetical protein [Alloscardovia theropitheci]TCD53888.1 hypothetical protein EJ419_06445 [Alloscardovia theropitheci]
MLWHQNQPAQYIASVYGVQLPPTVEVTSLHKEEGWDAPLCYGTLKAKNTGHINPLDAIANPVNFSPIKNAEETYIAGSKDRDTSVSNLINDVNQKFKIEKASLSSPTLLYQRFAIKGDSIFVVFYDTHTHDLFFYGTMHASR